MDMDIVELAKKYKAAKAVADKALKALQTAIRKEALASEAQNAAKPAKPKNATRPAKPKKATKPAKPKKAVIAGAPKNQPKSEWTPYRATLLKKMKKGKWITGFDARVLSGHEQGPGFTQNVLNHFLKKSVIKKRKLGTTTQWCLK
jgi:hypothetical protein